MIKVNIRKSNRQHGGSVVSAVAVEVKFTGCPLLNLNIE